jgi:hypothetical protein
MNLPAQQLGAERVNNRLDFRQLRHGRFAIKLGSTLGCNFSGCPEYSGMWQL